MSTANQDCTPPPSKKLRVELKIDNKSKSNLENLINIPGLQHLAENIFFSLNYDDLKSCQLLNRSSKRILDNPLFWLKKFVQRGVSRKNEMDWLTAIKLTRNTKLETNVLFYLRRCFKHQRLVDFPCFIDENVVSKSLKIVRQLDGKNIMNWDSMQPGFIQIFAAKSKQSDQFWCQGWIWNPKDGEIEFIKSLAPLMKNPNKYKHNQDGNTLLHFAAFFERVDLVKYLVSLEDNPNIPNKHGTTPLQNAAKQCYDKRTSDIATVIPSLEICSILSTFPKNSPNGILSESQIWGLWKALDQLAKYCADLILQLQKRIPKLDKSKIIFKERFSNSFPLTIQLHKVPREKINTPMVNQGVEKNQEARNVLNLNQQAMHNYNVLKRFEDVISKLEKQKTEDK